MPACNRFRAPGINGAAWLVLLAASTGRWLRRFGFGPESGFIELNRERVQAPHLRP